MPARVTSFDHFSDLIDTIIGNVDDPAGATRIETWKHQAHQFIVDSCADIGIVKMALDVMEDSDWTLIAFTSAVQFFAENLSLKAEMKKPEWIDSDRE